VDKEHIEIEAWGVDYERFALGKLLGRLTGKYHITTVAELPAFGAKAMPSIYSLGFGMAGANVTLINGNENYRNQWESLGIQEKADFVKVADLHNTSLPDKSYDFVWNFAYIPTDEHPDKLLTEMKRLSKKYVALFSVNGGNVGYYVHSALHKINKIPWTHGDKKLNYMRNITALMRQNGLRVIKKGYVDTPIWPDSLGFRDMRLHRNNITFDNTQWESPYVKMMRDNSIKGWMKAVYIWERIPMIPVIKTLYSHILYTIAEITED
jgi:hypothetical protein